MLKKISRFRLMLVLLLILPFLCSSGSAFGERRDDRGGRGDRDRHFYREGRWYRHDSSGLDIAVAALALGAFVESLPPQHTTVVVQGAPYYHDDSAYYAQAPNGGYVVVQPPVGIPPEHRIRDVYTVNIPNSRGGYTPVTLRRSGSGFIGPQGEYYPYSPTVDELRALYGR